MRRREIDVGVCHNVAPSFQGICGGHSVQEGRIARKDSQFKRVQSEGLRIEWGIHYMSEGILMASGDATFISQAEAQVATRAVRLVSFAELIQLVPKGPVDNNSVEAALKAFAENGVARHASTAELSSAHRMAEVLVEALDAIEDSPMPQREWRPIIEILGDDLVGDLLSVSESSIHRYRSGNRPTPYAVAARLHAIALIVADLLGSYNDFGTRRWFGRSRTALSGQSPAEVLSGDWVPDGEETMRVKALAASLLSPQAA